MPYTHYTTKSRGLQQPLSPEAFIWSTSPEALMKTILRSPGSQGDWMWTGSCDRLHVTSRGGGKWEHALDPSHLAIRSGRIARDCANRDCGPFRFGYLTCDHRLFRQKRTASPSPSLGVPTPRRIRTLSTLSRTGARVEARGNLDDCRWQRLCGKAPSRCNPPRRPF